MFEFVSRRVMPVLLAGAVGATSLTGCTVGKGETPKSVPSSTAERCPGLPKLEALDNSKFRFTRDCIAGTYDPADPYNPARDKEMPELEPGETFTVSCIQTEGKPNYAIVVNGTGHSGAINLSPDAYYSLVGLVPQCPPRPGM